MHTSRLVADLELGLLVTPSGRILIGGQVLPRDVFSDLSGDTRVWMRWAEPEETGEGPRLEFGAVTRRDEAARTARVVARAALANPRIAWKVYKYLECQGMLDLLLVGPTPPDGSCGELIHEIAYADLTRRSIQYGLPVHHFPERYV